MQRIAMRLLTGGSMASPPARTRGGARREAAAWRRRALLRPPRLHASRRAFANAPVTAIATPWRHGIPGLQRRHQEEQEEAPAVAPLALPSPQPLQRRLASLWQLYLQALARRPLLTKAATSFVCVVIGDSIAQCLGAAPFSAARVLKLAAYSSTVGACTGHHWHRWLEANVHPESPTSNAAVTKKMLLDQLLLTPIMTAVFFAALKLMEGRPEAILPFFQDKFLGTLLAGYAVWVPYNFLSFRFIPQDLRLLASNLVGIAWGAFVSVSCINSQQAPTSGAAGMTAPAAAACSAAFAAAGAGAGQPLAGR